MASGRPRTPTDEEMPDLLEALAASGGNVAAFARKHGLAAWKLYAVQRLSGGSRPRRDRRKAGSEFVRVHVMEERADSAAALELVLRSGHRLLIPAGFDETTLRRVMGVLASC